MPLKKSLNKKSLNVVEALSYHELGLVSSTRSRVNLIHALFRDKKVNLKKIYSMDSRNRIEVEDDKLYFDNFKTWFTLSGPKGKPLYLRTIKPQGGRFMDVLFYSGVITENPTPPAHDPTRFRPFLMAVTEDNWLVRHDKESGQLLQKVYLGTDYKFRYIIWETEGETVALLSTHIVFSNSQRVSEDAVEAVALFYIFPLRFLSLFEIKKQTFGREVKSVKVIDNKLLILEAKGGPKQAIRCYGMENMFSPRNFLCRCDIDKECHHSLNGSKVGSEPSGIPLNLKIRDPPSLLFEIECNNCYTSFGGFPFHYIRELPKSDGHFEVREASDGHVARDGTFKLDSEGYENKCFFHESNIFNRSANDINVYRLCPDDKECHCLICNTNGHKSRMKVVKKFDLSFKAFDSHLVTTSDPLPPSNTNRRSSPRSSRERKSYASPLGRSILGLDVDNNLDFIIVLAIEGVDCKAHLLIFDEDGTPVKKIDLKLKIEEEASVTLHSNCDTFVIIVEGGGQNTVHLYRLGRPKD